MKRYQAPAQHNIKLLREAYGYHYENLTEQEECARNGQFKAAFFLPLHGKEYVLKRGRARRR